MAEIDYFIQDPGSQVILSVACRFNGRLITETTVNDIANIKRYRPEQVIVITYIPCSEWIKQAFVNKGVIVVEYQMLGEFVAPT